MHKTYSFQERQGAFERPFGSPERKAIPEFGDLFFEKHPKTFLHSFEFFPFRAENRADAVWTWSVYMGGTKRKAIVHQRWIHKHTTFDTVEKIAAKNEEPKMKEREKGELLRELDRDSILQQYHIQHNTVSLLRFCGFRLLSHEIPGTEPTVA